ncbi:MAG: HlyD family efflux transporter periplasmic adaptor subunit [Bacteroidota bacterium]
MKTTWTVFTLLMIAACNKNTLTYDASGAFEAVETIVSSEASGVLKEFNVEEGQVLQAGQQVGYVDSLQLFLKRKQLQAQIAAVLSRKPEINSQVAALRQQLKSAEKDQQRYITLVKGDAAPQKKLDDINTQVEMLKSQISAIESSLNIASKSITEEAQPVSVQIEQINDQLLKCKLINPVNGTVLVKYAEPNEVTTTGKPLYKIADMSVLTLRAYITGDQLVKVKTGQEVKVLVDQEEKANTVYKGTVEWISDKAEFTPKTIQTREERADKVYAMKIAVKNDGSLKLGMYAEVNFK